VKSYFAPVVALSALVGAGILAQAEAGKTKQENRCSFSDVSQSVSADTKFVAVHAFRLCEFGPFATTADEPVYLVPSDATTDEQRYTLKNLAAVINKPNNAEPRLSWRSDGSFTIGIDADWAVTWSKPVVHGHRVTIERAPANKPG